MVSLLIMTIKLNSVYKMNEILKQFNVVPSKLRLYTFLYYDGLQIAVVLHSEDAILLDYVKIDLITHCLGDLSNFFYENKHVS